MPLEFAILNEDGYPEDPLLFNLPLHGRFIAVAEQVSASILLTLRDYWADLDIPNNQSRLLRSELEHMKAVAQTDGELMNFLVALDALAAKAETAQKPLAVIAD